MCNVKIILLLGAIMPKYATDGSSGADLHANLTDQESGQTADRIILKPGQRKLIPTGLKMEIPAGFEGQVRPRSGIAKKNKVTVLNAPGTIDADYRGEVGVLLVNHGENDFEITHGDKIAQLVFAKVERGAFIKVDELRDSDRGEGGFGSTGVSNETSNIMEHEESNNNSSAQGGTVTEMNIDGTTKPETANNDWMQGEEIQHSDGDARPDLDANETEMATAQGRNDLSEHLHGSEESKSQATEDDLSFVDKMSGAALDSYDDQQKSSRAEEQSSEDRAAQDEERALRNDDV